MLWPPSHRPPRAAALGLASTLGTLGVLALALLTAGSAMAARARVSSPPILTVSGSPVGRAMPAGFVGVANEYWDIEKEVGTNPAAPDVPYEQILRNLAPDGGLTLRIGGDSTDWAWWPIAAMKQPPWVRFTMTPAWAAVTKKLADDLHAHLILGINLESNSTTVANTEVRELSSHLGPVPITFEIGNEPELYSKFAFYNNAQDKPVKGRPENFTMAEMASQWAQIAGKLPDVRLAGPGYSSFKALPDVGEFLQATRKKLSLLTVHSYPLRSSRCGGTGQETKLFQPVSLQGLASGVTAWTNLAKEYSVPVRVDEMNSVTCGGMAEYSDAFAPALWALNVLPLYAEAGAAGVNFQSRPFTQQNLIQPVHSASGWHVAVEPEYYGLLAFAQLTPPGSRLLQVSELPLGLYGWAVRKPSGQTSVVVTNVTSASTTVAIHAAVAGGSATVEALRANSGRLWTRGVVTLGGQTVSPSTGKLTGSPATKTVAAAGGSYDVTIPAASAEIVTFSH